MINYLTKFIPRPLIAFPLFFNNTYCLIHTPQGTRKLDLYQKIKEKDMQGIKNNQLNEDSIERYYRRHRCDGCNSTLQSEDK